ncbi:hypothetical protein [Planococcus sp. YIM B11945]|uniref:hypothetical protein n=1 Tax=Planococcus sp. YIM B11945 TaxID=3435410 RepID=UPI003D7DA19B
MRSKLQFFIDHKKKKIHQRQYAGDRCGFVETPVDRREFTNSVAYIERLEMHSEYLVCPYCRSLQVLTD